MIQVKANVITEGNIDGTEARTRLRLVGEIMRSLGVKGVGTISIDDEQSGRHYEIEFTQDGMVLPW